jgi:hypothetical protein
MKIDSIHVHIHALALCKPTTPSPHHSYSSAGKSLRTKWLGHS